MASSSALTKHGFPRGYRFVPDCLEVLDLLAGRLRGRPLPLPLAGIFHDLRILDHHPHDLYEAYKEYEENGCIYFFSRREFPAPGAAGRAGDGGGNKKRRPVRAARGGGWKPSGGGKQLRRKGGAVAGRMVTMVFYERRRDGAEEKLDKTNWGMHEFTVPVGAPDKFSDLAVYRLYKVKKATTESKQVARHGKNEQADADERKPFMPTAAAQAGTYFTTNQALAAASTSQTTHQKQLSIGQIHQHYQHQHAFGAAATAGPSSWAPPAAADPQEHAKPVPGYFNFVEPPPQVTVPPPAAANLEGEQQQPPETATHGAGQDDGLFVVTPGAASPQAEQRTPAVSPPHAPSAGRDETMEEEVPAQPEVVPPPPEPALPAGDEDYMADVWNDEQWSQVLPGLSIDTVLDVDDFLLSDLHFSMEELVGPMEAEYPSGGDANNQAGGGQQDPPAALLTA